MENWRGGRYGDPQSKCSYFHELGHTRDICYILHVPTPVMIPLL